MQTGTVRRKRYRKIGAEVRGNGARALLAAVVLQAVVDAQSGTLDGDEARRWLRSTDCRLCLDLLDINHRYFLRALRHRRLRRGTSTRAYWEDALEPLELVA